MSNANDKYQRYLASVEWQVKREKCKLRAGYKCERCGSPDGLEIHHVTYERLYNERDEDLQCLCKGCHQFMHGIGTDPLDALDWYTRMERQIDAGRVDMRMPFGMHRGKWISELPLWYLRGLSRDIEMYGNFKLAVETAIARYETE